MKAKAIFLIDSDIFDKDLMRISLEKLTNCKVFNFFSLDEARLYIKLNPGAIIYSSNQNVPLDHVQFPIKVDFINISRKLNQRGKNILLRHTSLADQIISHLN
ncbi:MAG: hypothetical protein R3345_13145 [Fulvivirga sp.]|nr:hypothetical protein [Fulvivirga sp.]